MRNLLFLIFFLPLMAWAQSSMPPCPETGLKQNCFGTLLFPDGSTYVGEIFGDLRHGQGVVYKKTGEVFVSGVWREDNLLHQYILNREHFPFKSPARVEGVSAPRPSQVPSSLPPCASAANTRDWTQCFGIVDLNHGEKFIGEFFDGKWHGKGVYTYMHGGQYVGDFRGGVFNGEGINYPADGQVFRSGRWQEGRLVQSYNLNPSQFPFNPPSQVISALPVDQGKAERDRLMAEVEAERNKRQALEARLAKASEKEIQDSNVKELERQQEQVPQKQQQPQAVFKDKRRQALVIGNDAYQSVPKLLNARADARAMAKQLEATGFKVTLQFDLTERAMKDALRTFRTSVEGGDEVIVFFAGHGVQLGAANYLLPVDIRGDSEEQVKDEAIPLQRILDDLSERRARFSLAIVDACRDNPFKGSGRAIGGRGLAPAAAASGQMVIFSAGAGQQALDRLGDKDKDPNGLFTRIFLREMAKPGLSIDSVIRTVRNEVVQMAKSVGHEQVPALYDQTLGEFYFIQR